jgi:hypothetical protein
MTKNRSPKANGRRSSEYTIEHRVDDIFFLVVDGQSFRVIRQYVTENFAAGRLNWNVDERTLRRYVKRAHTRLLEAIPDEEKVIAAARHPKRLERLYTQAMQRGDGRLALDVVKENAKYYGLNAPDKHELTGPNGSPLAGMSAEELAAVFEERVWAMRARLKPKG